MMRFFCLKGRDFASDFMESWISAGSPCLTCAMLSSGFSCERPPSSAASSEACRSSCGVCAGVADCRCRSLPFAASLKGLHHRNPPQVSEALHMPTDQRQPHARDLQNIVRKSQTQFTGIMEAALNIAQGAGRHSKRPLQAQTTDRACPRDRAPSALSCVCLPWACQASSIHAWQSPFSVRSLAKKAKFIKAS